MIHCWSPESTTSKTRTKNSKLSNTMSLLLRCMPIQKTSSEPKRLYSSRKNETLKMNTLITLPVRTWLMPLPNFISLRVSTGSFWWLFPKKRKTLSTKLTSSWSLWREELRAKDKVSANYNKKSTKNKTKFSMKTKKSQLSISELAISQEIIAKVVTHRNVGKPEKS